MPSSRMWSLLSLLKCANVLHREIVLQSGDFLSRFTSRIQFFLSALCLYFHTTLHYSYYLYVQTHFEPRFCFCSSDARLVSFRKSGSLGIQVSGGNKAGIFVAAVKEGSPAYNEGLRKGDQVMMVCSEHHCVQICLNVITSLFLQPTFPLVQYLQQCFSVPTRKNFYHV